MGTVIKSKIVFKDLGIPALVKDHDKNELLLGTIIGRADGIKESKAADQMTVFKGLKGTFEAVPADPAKDTIRSGVIFLGDAFQADILSLLETEGGPDSVDFAFEIYAVKATNAAGYSWAMKPLLKASEADPLANIRALMAQNKPAEIAAPKK